MIQYEYKSKIVRAEEYAEKDKIEETCNAWALAGWEIFSVVVPQSSNYYTYRLTARRQIRMVPNTGRKFR